MCKTIIFFLKTRNPILVSRHFYEPLSSNTVIITFQVLNLAVEFFSQLNIRYIFAAMHKTSYTVKEVYNLFRATELQNKLSKLVPIFPVVLIKAGSQDCFLLKNEFHESRL